MVHMYVLMWFEGIFAPLSRISKFGSLSSSLSRGSLQKLDYGKVEVSHITAKVDTGDNVKSLFEMFCCTLSTRYLCVRILTSESLHKRGRRPFPQESVIVEERIRASDVFSTGWQKEGHPATKTRFQLPLTECTLPSLLFLFLKPGFHYPSSRPEFFDGPS